MYVDNLERQVHTTSTQLVESLLSSPIRSLNCDRPKVLACSSTYISSKK